MSGTMILDREPGDKCARFNFLLVDVKLLVRRKRGYVFHAVNPSGVAKTRSLREMPWKNL